jgi:hypothetical protein
VVKKILAVLLILFGVYFIGYSIMNSLWVRAGGYFFNIILECIIILIPCFVYYWELFARPPQINLRREASFWIITGIFFYMATIIPLYITGQYLIDHGARKMYESFTAINNLALVVTYLLFIKGFTCRIQQV